MWRVYLHNFEYNLKEVKIRTLCEGYEMEDFWFECRKKSGISLRQMSKLLHVSAYAYRAMEQGKIKFSPEITEMLYMMYMISPTSKVDERCLLNIEKQFAPLNEKERFYVAMKNLTGEGSYRSNYRKIKRVKDSISK